MNNRKRTWTAAGVTLVALIDCKQHVIPPARRVVTYQSKLQSGPSRLPDHVHSPGRRNGSQIVSHVVDNEAVSHILIDASLEHPDQVFAEIRRHIHRLGSSSMIRRHDRRELELTMTETLADSGNMFANANVTVEDVMQNKTVDFNVTAATEYNVSTVFQDSNSTNDTSTVLFTKSESTNATSSVKSFYPLRIRAFLSEQSGGGEHLTGNQHTILLQNMLRPALLSWSAALRVDPVVGNLTVDVTQLLDGVSCGPGIGSGLPSVLIPPSHFVGGVANTDMIVYLSIAFQNNTVATAGVDDVAMSTSQRNVSGSTSKPLALSEVYPNTVTPKAICAGDYLAASSICSTDQMDRPTAALLHICIGPDFFDKQSLQSSIVTLMHELGHSLGFNAVSLAHFRRWDGTPITPRGSNGEIPLQEIECTGPTSGRQLANVTLPSREILQFRTVRGVRVAQVVTPSVLQVARNHFDCQTLEGAELESGETLPLSISPDEVSCIGDHWERRLFKTDLMNPIVEDIPFTPRFSTLTLAFFADSGWYQVDLSRSALLASWGRGAGCAFVEEACINADGLVPPNDAPFFCNNAPRIDQLGFANDMHGCTPDLSRKAACSIGKYDGSLPVEYQYFNFTYGANVGGSDPFMDYCPIFAGFSNGVCADSKNEALIRVNEMERFGSKNSRCLTGRLINAAPRARAALCLPIACVVEDRSFRIQVDGDWQTCNGKDHILFSNDGNQVVCPDPIRICPTFYCYRDCLGTKRICNYTIGECVCNGSAVTDDVYASCQTDGENIPPGDSFFNSDPQNQNPNLPEEGSPLSDYYVSNERQLVQDPLFFASRAKTASLFIGVALGFALTIGFWLRRRRATGAQAWTSDDADGGPDPAASASPDKLKMMATIVVDLRMDHPNLSRSYADVLAERVSETDASMTNSDGAHSQPSIDESQDVLDIEPPLQQVTRRRRLFH